VFDPITLVAGAGILTAGTLLGRIRRRTTAAPSPVPTCGCGHPMALHDRDSDECFADEQRPHYSKSGSRNGFEWVQCPCRRYLGPDHIADVWVPPSATMRPQED